MAGFITGKFDETKFDESVFDKGDEVVGNIYAPRVAKTFKKKIGEFGSKVNFYKKLK